MPESADESGMASGPSQTLLELLDGLLAVLMDGPGSGAGEVRVRDQRPRSIGGFPFIAAPPEPEVLFLVEHVHRLVAQLGEFGAPSGPAAHGPIVEDRANDVDLLAAVDLVPQCLQDFADSRAVGVSTMQEPPEVLQAHVAGLQLLVIQHADAPVPCDVVALEGEVDFIDSTSFSAGAELCLSARRAAAEQDAF